MSQSMSGGAVEMGASIYQRLSVVMRRSMCVYDLPESEQRLAHWLVTETYDCGRAAGGVDFERWAQVLGFADSKGTRRDKCEGVFRSLEKLRLLNWNRVGTVGTGPQGTFELLPDAQNWSRLRRTRSLVNPAPAGTQELPFCATRELDEGLASASRDNALPNGLSPDHLSLQRQTQGRPVVCDWARLKDALNNPTELARLLAELERPVDASAHFAEKPSAEKSAEREIQQETSGAQGFSASADFAGTPSAKSAEKPIASLALVPRAKLAKASAEKSAETQATPEAALEFLRKVDRQGTLNGRFRLDYIELCQRHPGYVMERLRACFEEHERYYKSKHGQTFQIAGPVGWMGAKAAAEGRMKWHGTRQ
jgi:hypothetical protein